MEIWRFLKFAFSKAQPQPRLVEVTASGFRYHETLEDQPANWRSVETVEWRSIAQIEVERLPTVGGDLFYVMLHIDSGKVIELCDYRDGELFSQFTYAMHAEWPEISASWNRIYNGDPEYAERATLWKARESY